MRYEGIGGEHAVSSRRPDFAAAASRPFACRRLRRPTIRRFTNSFRVHSAGEPWQTVVSVSSRSRAERASASIRSLLSSISLSPRLSQTTTRSGWVTYRGARSAHADGCLGLLGAADQLRRL